MGIFNKPQTYYFIASMLFGGLGIGGIVERIVWGDLPLWLFVIIELAVFGFALLFYLLGRRKDKQSLQTQIEAQSSKYKLEDIANLVQDNHIQKREVVSNYRVRWWNIVLGFKLFFVLRDMVQISNIDLNKVNEFAISKKTHEGFADIANHAKKSLGFESIDSPEFTNYVKAVGHIMDEYKVGLTKRIGRNIEILVKDRAIEKLLPTISVNKKEITDKITNFIWYSYGINSFYLLHNYFTVLGGMQIIRRIGTPQPVLINQMNWQDRIESYIIELIAEIRQVIKDYQNEL